MFFNKVKCIFLKIRNCLRNKNGSASVEHMLILPIVILILTFVLNLSVELVEKGQHVLEGLSERRKMLLQVIKDKSGSITVFLCLFMTGFIILLTLLCDITGLLGGKAYFDDCSLTSVVSVSTAYNEQLKEKYKLAAIGRQELPLMEAQLKDNFTKTVHDEVGTMYPVQALDLHMLENNTLCDENELKRQIVKVARDMAAELAFESFKERVQDVGTSPEVNNDVEQELTRKEITEQEREVDGKVRDVLPEIFGRNFLGDISESSSEFQSGISIAKEIQHGVFDEGQSGLDWLVNNAAIFSDNVAIGEYVLSVFSNICSADDSGKGVPEAEYVISGKEDEDKSCKEVEDKIFALMYVINAKFFLTSPQYTAKTAETVARYSGGNLYVAAALEIIVPMAWISAESKLDVNSLINNEKVPVKKTEGTWKTKTIEQAGIMTVIKGVGGGKGDKYEDRQTKGKALNAVKSGTEKNDNTEILSGELSYRDCLRLFLLLESSEKKLDRIRTVVEKGVGISFEDLITEVELRTEGSISCLFTSGSWLPEKYKESGSGQIVKMGNSQVFNFGGIGENGEN